MTFDSASATVLIAILFVIAIMLDSIEVKLRRQSEQIARKKRNPTYVEADAECRLEGLTRHLDVALRMARFAVQASCDSERAQWLAQLARLCQHTVECDEPDRIRFEAEAEPPRAFHVANHVALALKYNGTAAWQASRAEPLAACLAAERIAQSLRTAMVGPQRYTGHNSALATS